MTRTRVNTLTCSTTTTAGPVRRNMAEERVLIPQLFTGAIEEDPAEFWSRIETFVDYKEMAEAEQLKRAKAMLVGGAQD